ncbi:hypothetical protein KIW84_050642 [Lathyrus oleraceus]|uniref:H(+)-exporting diphosphatase n=1 Tax=Pisum sativum TaxID=3888 RepID=A0A9D4WLT2_PEA|nr:hypothetical protein KIW84_050642 [Pisum sativum]
MILPLSLPILPLTVAGVTTVIAETATRTPLRTEKKPSLTPTPNDTFQVPSFLRRKANPKNVVSIILGGGSGVQLFPLTKRVATPAVPVGGCYRLIDIPMSNCINSGINKVFVLTQFNSASLNRHISRTYFGNGINFGDGYVEVLDVEFHNVKALYRRAQAYIETGDFLLADVDIKKALEVDPQNREVKTLKTKVKQLQADSDKKDAKLYENMFAHKPKRLKVEKEEDEVVKTEMDNVIADNVGDNVGDIAGMGSDLFGSYAEASCAALVVAGLVLLPIFAAMYGVVVAALGMLSTIATGLAIDAYGPISDNAGGIAEMAGMSHRIRERTDALDAAGNTTAAIGKGFAIGSAALVSLALFGAFVSRAGVTTVDVLTPKVFIGLIVGAMLPYWFSAMTMKSVGSAALKMVEEK